MFQRQVLLKADAGPSGNRETSSQLRNSFSLLQRKDMKRACGESSVVLKLLHGLVDIYFLVLQSPSVDGWIQVTS